MTYKYIIVDRYNRQIGQTFKSLAEADSRLYNLSDQFNPGKYRIKNDPGIDTTKDQAS